MTVVGVREGDGMAAGTALGPRRVPRRSKTLPRDRAYPLRSPHELS
jgi:hypothetical protein